MKTYTTLDGDVLALDLREPARDAFWTQYVDAFRSGKTWAELSNRLHGSSPLLDEGARVTSAVMTDPLYRAARDLADRAGILQGHLAFEEAADSDPFEDEFIPIAEVAAEQGVSLGAVYKAIERGTLMATAERPALVSRNSLNRWRVNEARQAAGKTRKATGGARIGRQDTITRAGPEAR